MQTVSRPTLVASNSTAPEGKRRDLEQVNRGKVSWQAQTASQVNTPLSGFISKKLCMCLE
jgi:hypothetical protein